MARERMITRTVVNTEYTVMTVNMENKQVESIVITVPSADTMTDKQLDTYFKNNMPSDHVFVQVTASETKEILYGMSEAEFIRLAKVLPSRTASKTE